MGRPKKNRIWFLSREHLVKAVTGARTFSTVLSGLGLSADGDNVRRLKERLSQERIDFSHFSRGQKVRGTESRLSSSVKTDLSRDRKAQIAEAAVLLRLLVHGFDVFKPLSASSKVDWLASDGQRNLRIQVKWAAATNGLPKIELTCHDGITGRRSRRYDADDFDFIVGYDFYSDTAYVFSVDDVRHARRAVTIRSDAAERWDKLRS